MLSWTRGIAFNTYSLTRQGPGVDARKEIAIDGHSSTQQGPRVSCHGGAHAAEPGAERLVPAYVQEDTGPGQVPEDPSGGPSTLQTRLTTTDGAL